MIRQLDSLHSSTISSAEQHHNFFERLFHGNITDSVDHELRTEAFNKLSTNMKEGLFFLADKVFLGTKWKIVGSNAAKVRAEKAQINTNDIDIDFLITHIDTIRDRLKSLSVVEKGSSLIRNFKEQKIKNYKGIEGTFKFSFEIRTGNEPDYKWVEVEAFSEPEPRESSREKIYWTDNKILVEILQDGELKKLPIAEWEEIVQFYVILAEGEFKGHKLEAYLVKTHQNDGFFIKYKFAQRLENVLAAVLRRIRENFEILKKSGEIPKNQQFNTEYIGDEDIEKFLSIFEKFDEGGQNSLSLFLRESFLDFKKKRTEGTESHKSFGLTATLLKGIQSLSGVKSDRERVLEMLRAEILEDMEYIWNEYRDIQQLKANIHSLKKQNRLPNNPKLSEKIKILQNAFQSKLASVIFSTKEIKNKYLDCFSAINYSDNRDFIPFITIRHILFNYILPSLFLALDLDNEINKKLTHTNSKVEVKEM